MDTQIGYFHELLIGRHDPSRLPAQARWAGRGFTESCRAVEATVAMKMPRNLRHVFEDDDSSSDEKVDPATSEKAQEKTHGDRMRAAMPPASERGQSCEDATQVFLESPFEWCLEHERSLLQSSNGDLPDERDSGNCNGKATAAGASSLAEALQAARIPRLVEVKPCSELRRLLAQEVGLPTCVAASNKLVGVGTLRGAVVLLDNKLQDVPKDNKPQVLSPGEEASAVTSAAFSIDGGSLLVGHKSGQLALWDLASQKVACVVQDVHSSPVLSLAFCRPSWQYALSADAKGSVYFISFFTGTFGRLDFEKQLLLEQSSSIGVTLRVLPLQVSSQQNHPADTHCLVALCASSATVLLTLHPSASVVQKIQYNAKDASWVPDATWLRMESQDWTQSPQAEVVDPQLCVAYGQTIHIMRVSYGMNEVKGKEEFKVSLLGRYSWGFPIRGLVSFNDSVIGVLDGTNRLSVVQLPHAEVKPATGTVPLSAVHSEDTTNWSLVFHTTPVDGREMRSHHGALGVFRGRSRTLYICGMKEVWSFQIGRWGQHIESVVARNDWSTALDVLLALRRGSLPPLLDFPHATTPRQKAVESRITQVIQSYLVNTLRPDAARFQVRQICFTAINVCIEAELWPVLYKTVFECFKATGHMNVYCTALEPFIVHGRIPRKEMDSEVLSSILQSYALPLEEEEQASHQAIQDGSGGSDILFRDLDHFPNLFPVARRLQQLVLCVDVSRLDLNLAIRLFTQHRLWTALVHVYCALGDFVSPLELLVGECTQLAKRCSSGDLPEEAPLLQCLLVRKLFFFIYRCFELRAFPLEPKDALGLVQPGPNAIVDLLACIFKTSDPSKAPPMFLRLLRLSFLGFFNTLSALFTSPSASRAMQDQAAAGKISWWKDTQQGSLLKALFELIQSSLEAAKTQSAEEGNPLPAHAEKEFLWFVAKSLPRARAQLPIQKVMQVVDHVLCSQGSQGRQRKVEQLLIGVLSNQESFDDEHSAAVINKAMNGFWGLASWLHERSGEYGKALDCRLQDPELREQIFEYIIAKLAEELNPALIEATLHRLQALVEVDNELCSLMLCEQFANVPDHSTVLDSLKPYPQMEMRYLEALLLRWTGAADRQAFFNMHVVRYIDLLCQHCPSAVLPFILENEALPLRECLELCGRYRVTDASVHLLERTGDFASVLQLMLSDYQEAIDKLCACFNGQGDRTIVSKAVKRLLGHGHGGQDSAVRSAEAWWEGFAEAQKCVNLLQNVYDLSSRNSNIMTEVQLEELWFGILGFTVRKQESLPESAASERRKTGLGLALRELAAKAMAGVLAYLSLPRCLKWICAEFGQSTLGIWKEPLQSMLSGLGFQQGLLQAAASVAAQDVMKPFVVLKMCGSRGALVSPRTASLISGGGLVKVPLVSPIKARAGGFSGRSGPCLRLWHHTEHAVGHTVFPAQALGERPEATNRSSDEKKIPLLQQCLCGR
ncbi:unnamed protein product [Cladocopium goreaui]|uniref:Vacuolar protein sorting-associated protein 8-like n=1 Tax=Cladocopium goreaui TaxID=2562237 RepID=A0A9P1CQZ1_9DINO|nr:unnamed protein product [Cladocopium goreaui]